MFDLVTIYIMRSRLGRLIIVLGDYETYVPDLPEPWGKIISNSVTRFKLVEKRRAL
ncbi:MAG: hypothetical protein QW254_04140 [Desulfurococcaceae archaeon]